MLTHSRTISELCDVDVTGLTTAEQLKPLADRLTEQFYPGCKVSGYGLFTLDPGQVHPAHKDIQPPEWVTRIHVPIVTNPMATATTDDGTIHMERGKAYTFNTRETHAVFNGGTSPRVHFVFDVHDCVGQGHPV
jgi:hypothetical protein